MERGRGRRYADPLRDRVVRWVRARRERGATWHEMAGELGIAAESLRRWASSDGKQQTALVPIEVVADSDRMEGADRRLCLVTRVGHRIERLSLDDVIELVRVLG
jgi:transposase-like protein